MFLLYQSIDVASLILCVGLQAAAQCYIDLIIKESDNNVKLIVLDRLIELKEHPTHERVLQVGGTQTKVEVLGLAFVTNTTVCTRCREEGIC